MRTILCKDKLERSAKWLQSVQNSSILLDLPLVEGPDGEEDYNNPIRTGDGIRNNYDW